MSAELKPCPFCGCDMRITSNNDWHSLYGDHDDLCPFDIGDTTMCVPADPTSLAWLHESWNRRAVPAQGALSDALPDLPPTPRALYQHPQLGEMFDRFALHQYAVKYADLCIRGQVSDAADAWISVSDRLPEEGERVLIATPSGFVRGTTYWPNGIHPGDGWSASIVDGPTHWQPLPAPPAMQAQAVDAKGGAA